MSAWSCRALATCLLLLCAGATRAEIEPRLVLRVITGHAAPFVQPPGTPVSGFSIEVWQEVARRLNVETDWTVLPEDERRTMLIEHGQAARDYPDVRANTLSAFALGDYEWILAFEADELHRIVDLMRELRATEARRHVREEVPFFTGPRVQVGDLVATLP